MIDVMHDTAPTKAHNNGVFACNGQSDCEFDPQLTKIAGFIFFIFWDFHIVVFCDAY
jgi:hypothetical protein